MTRRFLLKALTSLAIGAPFLCAAIREEKKAEKEWEEIAVIEIPEWYEFELISTPYGENPFYKTYRQMVSDV